MPLWCQAPSETGTGRPAPLRVSRIPGLGVVDPLCSSNHQFDTERLILCNEQELNAILGNVAKPISERVVQLHYGIAKKNTVLMVDCGDLNAKTDAEPLYCTVQLWAGDPTLLEVLISPEFGTGDCVDDSGGRQK